MSLEQVAAAAKAASIPLAAAKTADKNKALGQVSRALQGNAVLVAAANQQDLQEAQQNNLAGPLLKRLRFDQARIAEVCQGIESLIQLEDPTGKTLYAMELDKGLDLYKVTCPIGVVGIIFESRPDALVQISTLCLKSGNAVLLKGGSEASRTNRILTRIIAEASVQAGMPDGWIQLLETRQQVTDMLALDRQIDLIVPRGSNAFVRYIIDHTRIPVLGHADGICHVYVEGKADLDKAVRIVVDSKCQYVAVCNAAETLLVDESVAAQFLPKVKAALEQKSVEIRGCDKTQSIIPCKPATEEDWSTEYLDTILSIKIVAGVEEAILHINTYGSRHTDAIVTEDRATAARFLERVDSADVFWNCSTRFSDGFRYGLGAEVGVSTNKIHARGPVGLEGLVIYKWRLLGNGHVVADYAGPSARRLTHVRLKKDYPLR
jgi:glutamate-5-semialdehyde dehydrogenase